MGNLKNPRPEQVLEALPLSCISGPWKCTVTAAGNAQHQAWGGGWGAQYPVSIRSINAAMSKRSMPQAKALFRGNELGLGAWQRTCCSRHLSPRLLCALEAQALSSSSCLALARRLRLCRRLALARRLRPCRQSSESSALAACAVGAQALLRPSG